MSRRNVDNVKTNIYDNFGKFNNNPTNNKQVRREQMYMRILSEVSMNRFKWEGLPNTVDERFLEKVLFENGLAVFFYENKDFNAYLALRGSPSGRLNMYDNPISYTVTGNTQISRVLSSKHCVPIWSNFSRTPDRDIINIFSEQLATLDRSIEINSFNLRQNRIIVAEENQRLSFANFNKQLEEGASAVFTTSSILQEGVSVLDVGGDPRSLPALMETRVKTWNQCMLLLGINNNPGEEKTERLVSDEVSANDDQVKHQRSVSLNARRQACEVMNRRYGLSVSVDYVSGDNQGFSGQIDDFGLSVGSDDSEEN